MSGHREPFMPMIKMNQAWRDRAECKKHDPRLWFADDHHDQAKAMLICKTCPVQTECLDFALEHNERGVWGSTSERARRRMKREAPTTGHGTIQGFSSEMRSGGIPCELCLSAAKDAGNEREANLATLLFALRSLQAS